MDYNHVIDVSVPLAVHADTVERRTNHFISTVGRLKAGAEMLQAETDLNDIAATLDFQVSGHKQGLARPDFTPLQEAVGDVGGPGRA